MYHILILLNTNMLNNFRTKPEWKSPELFIPFIFFSVIIFGDSASYLLEMTVLISLEGILTQTRMVVGWVALPSKRP